MCWGSPAPSLTIKTLSGMMASRRGRGLRKMAVSTSLAESLAKVTSLTASLRSHVSPSAPLHSPRAAQDQAWSRGPERWRGTRELRGTEPHSEAWAEGNRGPFNVLREIIFASSLSLSWIAAQRKEHTHILQTYTHKGNPFAGHTHFMSTCSNTCYLV